jgi:hypothetical protein
MRRTRSWSGGALPNRSSYIYENPTDYTQDPYTDQQLSTAANAAGIAPATLQQEYHQSFTPVSPQSGANPAAQQPASGAPAPVQNPGWIFAVNLPSTYPDYAALRAAGTGLVVVADDPNAAALIAGARAWGIPVAVQVNAPPGITPAEYAARVAQAQQYAPDKLVLDIEVPGKGDPGSDGWNWSNQAAQLLKPIVGDTQVAVTMEPHQSDYNYKAYVGLSTGGSTQFWVQNYTGNMTPVDASYASSAAAQAVGAANVVNILAPGAAPTAGAMYASYGIPTAGQTAGGIYAGLSPVSSNTTPGTGLQPHIPGEIPETGPTGPGSPTPPGYNAPPGPSKAQQKAMDQTNAYFSSLGLPTDIQSQVTSIFAKYPDDPELAIELARQYVRTTPWFSATFPGFFDGVRTGLFTDESGYRQYVNQANVYTQQYFGRPITTGEIGLALKSGYTPEYLGRQYEAGAIANANMPDWRYTIGAFGESGDYATQLFQNNAGKAAGDLGEQQAGIGSMSGARLQAALDRANKRLQSVFGGQLAIPNTAGQALAPPTRPDIGA